MTWGSFKAGDVEFDLSHLSPFTVAVTPKAVDAPTYKVLVSFGHHTFTRDLVPGDADEMKFVHGAEERCFCKARHAHSLHLPGIVNSSASGRAYFSQTRNYLLVEDLPGVHGPYAVFFNIERARIVGVDAAMFVVSAYPKPAMPPKKELSAITFATLVAKTARGEQVTRPKK